jgi:hypothetical protein
MRIDQFIRKNRWFDSAFLVFFILAFSGGCYNHATDILRGGLFPYSKWYGAPEIFNWYWTSLILLDFFAVAAVCLHVRLGYVVALCIMLTDVPINFHANAMYWMLPVYKNSALMMQTAFLVFLLLTARRIWRLSGAVEEGTN